MNSKSHQLMVRQVREDIEDLIANGKKPTVKLAPMPELEALRKRVSRENAERIGTARRHANVLIKHQVFGTVRTTVVVFQHDPQLIRDMAEETDYVLPTMEPRLAKHLTLDVIATATMLGLSPNTFAKYRREGDFPQPLGWKPKAARRLPVYTIEEVMTYTRLLKDLFPNRIRKPFVANPLAARDLRGAKEQLRLQLVEGERAQWRATHG